MDKGSEKFYITTPIYYVNARPHIGHAYTTLVCDAIARRKRMLGFDTYFLTGTDEHGQKIERSAVAAGKTPKQFADEVSELFRSLFEKMNISNDDFIRTTEPRHKAGAQELWKRIQENRHIYKGTYTGQYCVSDELYVDCGWPWRSLPGVRTAHRDGERRELLLQAFRLCRPVAGPLPAEPRLHSSGDAPQ